MAWPDDGNFDAWLGRCTFTVDPDEVDEAVPIAYVRLSDMPAEFWAAVDSGGADVRVAQSDGETEVAAYITVIDTGAETGGLFFLATGMSTSLDTVYYIYWNNIAATEPDVTDGNGRDAVFADYAAAYLPGMTTDDLTGSYDLTAFNTPGTAASGIEGITAADYNGTDQYHMHTFGTPPITDWPATLEVIGAADFATQTGSPASYGNNGGSNGRDHLQLTFGGTVATDPILGTAAGSSAASRADSTTGYTATQLHHLMVSRDVGTSGTTRTRIDGGSEGTNTTDVTSPTFTDMIIGANQPSSGHRWFNGQVAMVLLSDSVRSGDYAATLKRAITSATFYTIGAFEDGADASGETDWVEFTVATIVTADGGTATWSNKDNALTSITGAATSDVLDGEYSRQLWLTNPAGALDEILGNSINGIIIEVNATGEDGVILPPELFDYHVQLIIGGSVVGSDLQMSGIQWGDDSIETREYGSSTQLWGLTPADTDLADSGFGVMLQYSSEGNEPGLMSIYLVRCKVHYGVTPEADDSGFFLAFVA